MSRSLPVTDAHRPPGELIRALAVLVEPPTSEQRTLARLLGLGGEPTPSAYSDVFLFQLYPYASVHLGMEGMMGGAARERIAGFWRAVGQEPPAEPDHLAALLGLYTTLAEAEARARGAEARLVGRSRVALLHEHLAPWVFAFLTRVEEIAGGVYGEWATLLADVLRMEALRAKLQRAERLPVHMTEATPLPDPRIEGGDGFLSGLLAPARSGVLLTRADLARLAGRLELGLRAGERRYALEHLLAQAPGPVLRALASESARQAHHHRARRGWLGPIATAWATTATGTVRLLEALAEDVAAADAVREESLGLDAADAPPGG